MSDWLLEDVTNELQSNEIDLDVYLRALSLGSLTCEVVFYKLHNIFMVASLREGDSCQVVWILS